MSDLWSIINQHLPQVFAGILVALYAWKRYGTPSSNRSSTTRAQFYFTGCAYVLCALSLFLMLSSLLEQPEAKKFVTFGVTLPDDASKLSAPFLSALILTTLLPSIPFVSEIDSALLKFFQHLGSIPIEVRRLRRDLKQMEYRPPQRSIALARDFLGAYPHIPQTRLASDQGTSIQHQFTRVICLYCEMKDLDESSGFMEDFVEETAELEKLVALVCAQGGGYFSFAQTPGVGDDALQDATAAFDKACDAANDKICWLFARGLLNASWSGNRLRQRLINLGFRIVGTHAPFVLNVALTTGLIVFAVFFFGMILMRLTGHVDLTISRQVTLAIVISVNYGIAATLAIVPKENWAFAKRTPERGRSVLAYVISALLTGLAAIGTGVTHTSLWEGGVAAGFVRYFSVTYPWIIPPVVVAFVLAFLSDNFALAKSEPRWLRWSEGGVMGVAVAASTFGAAEWFKELLKQLHGPIIGVPPGAPSPAVYALILIAISIPLGLTLGMLVPSAYRKARRADDMPPAAPAVLQPVAIAKGQGLTTTARQRVPGNITPQITAEG